MKQARTDTVKVNICYRPLRICWAIAAGDHAAFREAVTLSNTMWGGRYNPIVIVDHEEATSIAEVFRADIVVRIGTSESLIAFKERFNHLISPFFHDSLFVGNAEEDFRAQCLDVHNALVYLNDSSALKAIIEKGVRLYSWDDADPLRDVLLMQLGAYPDVAQTRIKYRELLKDATNATEYRLDKDTALPADLFEHPSIPYLARHGLRRHYGIQNNWDFTGFYLGDCTSLDDLVNCWNLRALDTPVLFVDRNHLDRYRHVIPAWSQLANHTLSTRKSEHQRQIAIWTRRSQPQKSQDEHNRYVTEVKHLFGDVPFTFPSIDVPIWNGLNLKAPMMILGDTDQLGVLMVDPGGAPKLSFSLGDKPYYSDDWFYSQHLVASLSFIGGLYGDELHTLDPPYIPELNEFYGRNVHFDYNKVRVEPERVGVIIDANDSDAFIRALPVADLVERIFKLAGFEARPSTAGLITRQLITQLGGLRGGVVFKIPGARRLLRTFGPTDRFTESGALSLIGGTDPDNPVPKFEDYEDLFIEPRPFDKKLTKADVFGCLVDKGVFRIGAELSCPHCRMTSWISLDTLRQNPRCDMCGLEFDATRQLVRSHWSYRRSGLLGAEKNSQGAIPVILTLQQLKASFHSFRHHVYSTSLDLKPIGPTGPTCEVDFVWLESGDFRSDKVTVILGECKDRGKKASDATVADAFDAKDIENLRAVADAFPKGRFDVYILLAKLSPFTDREIQMARGLNDRWHKRVILLTDRELEPWPMYKRTNVELKIDAHGGSAEQLALTTAQIYFPEPAPAIHSVERQDAKGASAP